MNSKEYWSAVRKMTKRQRAVLAQAAWYRRELGMKWKQSIITAAQVEGEEAAPILAAVGRKRERK